ncbi:hypothetical protein OS125_10750 [Corynebacterium sp. P7003]|uniref:Transcriptional regulator n=1 Tax=Corynebacterium pygosceleis TaxID=2800406 RepID=A0ABT3X0B9_9CORY|nr:hypothetical protein [Corynebacterium pygosceleis]MCX7445711.1 hypothetical protein [Corynebacterium pygosceleis]
MDKPRKQVRASVRLFQLLLLAVAVLATLLLAWWQWTRFQSGSGSFQNLGYALQWPTFGIFFIYAYRKIGQYEREVEETGQAPAERERAEREARGEITEIDEDFLPPRPSIDVDTFNALNTPRRRRDTTE